MARGSIRPVQRKGKDGRSYVVWQARVPAGLTATGKRRQKTKNHRTRTEAQKWVAEQLASGGNLLASDGMTVADLLARWLPLHERQVRASTARCDRWAAGVILPALGHLRLDKLTPLTLQAFYDALDRRYAPRSVQMVHRVLTGALKQATAWEVIGRNPATATKRSVVVRKPMDVWSADEAQRFLDETRDDFDGPCFALLLWTGLRIGEALALDWRHVDLEAGWLTVERTITRTAEGKAVVGTRAKSRTSHRRIPLALPAQAALRRQQVAQEKRRHDAGALWVECGAVFDSGDGTRRTDHAVRNRLARLCERMGMARVSPHSFRHTCASLLLRRGISPKLVQDLLGHSSAIITMDIYGHVSDDDRTEVARAMESVLRDERAG
jgi:integrase